MSKAPEIAFCIGAGVTTALLVLFGFLSGYTGDLSEAVSSWGSDSGLAELISFGVGCFILLGAAMIVGYASSGLTKLVQAVAGNRRS